MKKFLLLAALSLSSVIFHLSTIQAQNLNYGYSPRVVNETDINGYGSGKNNFLSVAQRFSADEDPLWNALKGKKLLGVRVYLREEYKQKTKKWSSVEAYEEKLTNEAAQQTYVNFAKGWNEVLFNEPIIIGDKDIYLAADVFELFGDASYPFCTFSGSSDEFYAKVGDEAWQKASDHGVLLIQAIVEADEDFLDNTAIVSFSGTPMVINPGNEFEGKLYICNTGREVMNDIDLELSDGDTSQEWNLDFTTPLQPGEATVINFEFTAGKKTGTSVEYTLSVKKINGNDAKQSRTFHKNLLVTDDSFDRIPLIEEFTSQRCQNCPFMFYFLEQAMDEWKKDGNKLAYVSHHAGFAEDKFTSAVDRELLYLFGGETYNPAVMYDRRVFSGEVTPVHSAKNVAEWDYYYDAISAVGNVAGMAKINIDVTKNEDDEDVVKVWGLLNKNIVDSGQKLYLSTYLIENNISTKDFPQLGLDDPEAPADLAEKFRHNGVIRINLNETSTGDLLTVNKGEQYTFEVTYDPIVYKSAWNKDNLEIVAFINLINQKDLSKNYVLNAGIWNSETSAVSYVENVENAGNAGNYNLAGQKVGNGYKGIVIKNGKKYFAK